MFGFRRSRDPLQETTRLSTADRLVALMEEQNRLLRELVVAVTGKPSLTPRVGQPVSRIYTDKDVYRVTRADQLQQEQERQMRHLREASGLDSAPIVPPAGTARP